MEINKMPKNAKTYECKKCSFICIKKSNYNIHLLTAKHLRKKLEKNGNNGNIKNAINYTDHICSKCNKQYVTNDK